MLLGLTPRAMSRDALPEQQSGTLEDPSTVNPTPRDKTLKGMSILYGTNENANTSIPPPPTTEAAVPKRQLSRDRTLPIYRNVRRFYRRSDGGIPICGRYLELAHPIACANPD